MGWVTPAKLVSTINLIAAGKYNFVEAFCFRAFHSEYKCDNAKITQFASCKPLFNNLQQLNKKIPVSVHLLTLAKAQR
jgi:hypothetical protein